MTSVIDKALRRQLEAEVARLTRENQELKLSTVNHVADPLIITGLEAQIKRLRVENEYLEMDMAYYKRDWKENARLRAGLERIVTEARVWAAHNKLETLAQEMYDIADEALRGAGEKP